MITITITRNTDNQIQAFTVAGHANYAEHGKDIVCAAVSAVTIGTINSLHTLDLINRPTPEIRDGFISIAFDAAAWHNDKVQLLLESMILILRMVEEEPKGYIKVEEVISCLQT